MILPGYDIALGENAETAPREKQEYEHDYRLVVDTDASVSQSEVKDINAYEQFADIMDQRWRERNREYHARLMLAICRPLSSGTFREQRRYLLAREYAFSALEEPDSISLQLELELLGHMVIMFYGSDAPGGDDFAQKRAEDTALRLHAWRRLLEAIDPDWNPDELPIIDVSPPVATGLPAGVVPSAIQDSTLRTEYEEAIRVNREKAQKYNEQYEYRKWLKRIPYLLNNNIIQEYSHPPFAIQELREMLDKQLPNQEAKARIIGAVEKNMRERKEREK